MIFKKALLFLTFIAVALPLFSQGKYALSYSDFMNNKWTDINIAHAEEISSGNEAISESGYFKFVTESKEADDLLKKQARFVIYEGILYVNCRSLKCDNDAFRNWYVRAYRLDYENICFTAMTIGKAARGLKKAGVFFVPTTGGGAIGILVGAVGSAIGTAILADSQAKKQAKDGICYQSCYILTSDSSAVYRVNSKYMKAFLRDSPELRKEYTKIDKEKNESPEVILEYFNKLQLLSNY